MVAGLPLVMMVGLSKGQVLAPWWSKILLLGVAYKPLGLELHAPLRDPCGRAEGGQKEESRGDLPHARPRAASFTFDGTFDTRPEQIAVPCRMKAAGRVGDLVPAGQLLPAGFARRSRPK